MTAILRRELITLLRTRTAMAVELSSAGKSPGRVEGKEIMAKHP